MKDFYKTSGSILAIIYIITNILQTKGIITTLCNFIITCILFGCYSIYIAALCIRIYNKTKIIAYKQLLLLVLCLIIIMIQLKFSLYRII